MPEHMGYTVRQRHTHTLAHDLHRNRHISLPTHTWRLVKTQVKVSDNSKNFQASRPIFIQNDVEVVFFQNSCITDYVIAYSGVCQISGISHFVLTHGPTNVQCQLCFSWPKLDVHIGALKCKHILVLLIFYFQHGPRREVNAFEQKQLLSAYFGCGRWQFS